jgi:hypothetical protein
MGVSAAAIQAFLQVQPPVAYGINFIGHPRDLITWVINNIFGTDLASSGAFLIYPALTVIGVFIGSFMAANRNNELKLRPGPVINRFKAAMYGFLLVNLGLLWTCPIRTALLISYGSITALVVLICIIVGVILAVKYIRYRVKRETSQ